MGDKIQAKLHVSAAGVPVVPGRVEVGMSDRDLQSAAKEIGFPVLVKPSAGGGGKGMRLVERPEDLDGGALELPGVRRWLHLATTRSSSSALSFAPDISRFRFWATSTAPSCTWGSVSARCSDVTRRSSKSRRRRLLDDATRQRLCASAIDAARSVDYYGVGTVEFIVSSQHPDEFFFMEMNTRLQVEHPVTEMVTGLDLVEQQLLVAVGRAARFDVRNAPHSAATPSKRASTPKVRRGAFFRPVDDCCEVHEPSGEGVRVDSGLREGARGGDAVRPDARESRGVGTGSFDRAAAPARGTRRHGDPWRRHQHRLPAPTCSTDDDVTRGDLDTGLIERDVGSLVSTAPSIAVLALYARFVAGAARRQWIQRPVIRGTRQRAGGWWRANVPCS